MPEYEYPISLDKLRRLDQDIPISDLKSGLPSLIRIPHGDIGIV